MNNVVNLTEDKLMLGGLLFEEALLLAKRRKKVKPSLSGWYISFVSYHQYSFLKLINKLLTKTQRKSVRGDWICNQTFTIKEIPNGFPCLDDVIQTRGMLRDCRKASVFNHHFCPFQLLPWKWSY